MKSVMKPAVVTILVYISSTLALRCFVCNSVETPACHDLRDVYVNVEECKGSLAWRESFACLKNTSLRNNLIETDRKCVIVQGVDRVCRGRKHPNLFGDCLLCQFDECNGEDVENGSIVNRLNFKLFCAIITVIVVALNNVKCQR